MDSDYIPANVGQYTFSTPHFGDSEDCLYPWLRNTSREIHWDPSWRIKLGCFGKLGVSLRIALLYQYFLRFLFVSGIILGFAPHAFCSWVGEKGNTGFNILARAGNQLFLPIFFSLLIVFYFIINTGIECYRTFVYKLSPITRMMDTNLFNLTWSAQFIIILIIIQLYTGIAHYLDTRNMITSLCISTFASSYPYSKPILPLLSIILSSSTLYYIFGLYYLLPFLLDPIKRIVALTSALFIVTCIKPIHRLCTLPYYLNIIYNNFIDGNCPQSNNTIMLTNPIIRDIYTPIMKKKSSVIAPKRYTHSANANDDYPDQEMRERVLKLIEKEHNKLAKEENDNNNSNNNNNNDGSSDGDGDVDENDDGNRGSTRGRRGRSNNNSSSSSSGRSSSHARRGGVGERKGGRGNNMDDDDDDNNDDEEEEEKEIKGGSNDKKNKNNNNNKKKKKKIILPYVYSFAQLNWVPTPMSLTTTSLYHTAAHYHATCKVIVRAFMRHWVWRLIGANGTRFAIYTTNNNNKTESKNEPISSRKGSKKSSGSSSSNSSSNDNNDSTPTPNQSLIPLYTYTDGMPIGLRIPGLTIPGTNPDLLIHYYKEYEFFLFPPKEFRV